MELNLDEIRQEIDKTDASIVELFEKRMELCKNVAAYKIETGKKVFDKEREEQKIEKVTALASDDFNKKGVEELFTQVMTISRKMQYQILSEKGIEYKVDFEEIEDIDKENVTVVYQGVEGAYSHQAMLKYFGEDVKNFNVVTFGDAMKAIKDGKADYAVLPIENSTEGRVNDVYDLLVQYDNYIVDYIDLTVRHALLGTKDAEISDIKEVYSHQQGLRQCTEFLDEHSEWSRIAQLNTAGSAKKVALLNDKTKAAIASLCAAKQYGLKVLAEDINRNINNFTRFIIVSKNKVYKKESKKVCICFEIPHKSGTLYRILTNFIYNDLNMTKIESRPIKDRTGEYKFFVEFDGNFDESAVKNALRGVAEETNWLKVLGNY